MIRNAKVCLILRQIPRSNTNRNRTYLFPQFPQEMIIDSSVTDSKGNVQAFEVMFQFLNLVF